MSANLYQQVDITLPGRSAFSLTHNRKTTYKIGYNYPNLVIPVSPGDAIKGRTSTFLRFQPLIHPLLHEVDVYQRYFFVPYRLVCEGWQKWWAQEEGNQPGDINEEERLAALPAYFTVDDITRNYLTVGSLADHLGIPPMIYFDSTNDTWATYTGPIGANNRISALPFKAYSLIWNEYYRDENLEQPINIHPEEMGRVPFDGTTDAYVDYIRMFALARSNWQKDYFTASLPGTQKGNPVQIGNMVTQGDVPVIFKAGTTQTPKWKNPVTGAALSSPQFIGIGSSGRSMAGSSQAGAQGLDQNFTPAQNAAYDPAGSLFTHFGDPGQPYTVEALRMSMMLQKYYELLMRGGSRYVEQLRNIFGVTPDDLRIGRPKYLGGGVQNVMVSEVVQQSQSTETSNLGELAGKALSLGNQNTFRHFVTEHGLIMGICSIVPRSGYGQGMPKEWIKEDQFEFLNPKFDHLGEQPVYDGELFYDYSKTREQNLHAFGYMPNYMEYRIMNDTVHGEMRTSLSGWNLNRLFDSTPALNSDFIKVKEIDVDRVFAVDTSVADPVIGEHVHHIQAIRPLSKYGTPAF